MAHSHAGAWICRAQCVGRRVALIRVAYGQRHMHACRSERARSFQPQAGGTPGDDGIAALKQDAVYRLQRRGACTET